MGGARQPTPQELAAIEEYMMLLQSDPMARAANDYGQGSSFLQLDEQPESWDRLGEKNDLYTDLFKTTQTYLADFVPDLYPEVEDPGQFAGYRSDQADLYRNNSAYTQLEAAMAEGASFDEAVQLIAAAPEFQANLPKTERGQVDLQAFRNSAETFVSERAREGREFDEYDAERQAYEDYVNPKTRWDVTNVPDITPFLKNEAVLPTFAEGKPVQALGRTLHPGLTPGGPPVPQSRPIDQSRLGGTFNRAQEPAKPAARNKSTRTPEDRAAGNKAYNKGAQSVYDFQKKKQSGQQVASKKQQNMAKMVQAYNMLMYGE